MSMKTYPMRVEDGKVYAEVTLRDVVERCDVSDLPMLAEVKRLYTENDRLRELVRHIYTCMVNIDMDGNHECYSCEYENANGGCDYEAQLNELGIEVDA